MRSRAVVVSVDVWYGARRLRGFQHRRFAALNLHGRKQKGGLLALLSVARRPDLRTSNPLADVLGLTTGAAQARTSGLKSTTSDVPSAAAPRRLPEFLRE